MATPAQRVTLEVTSDMRTAMAQLNDGAHSPRSLNAHASFVRLDKKTDKLERVVHIYQGTNCGMYWAVGFSYQSEHSKDAWAADEEECELDFEDTDALGHVVETLLRTLKYVCVMNYTTTTEPRKYQLPRLYYPTDDVKYTDCLFSETTWKELHQHQFTLRHVTLPDAQPPSWKVYTLRLDRLYPDTTPGDETKKKRKQTASVEQKE